MGPSLHSEHAKQSWDVHAGCSFVPFDEGTQKAVNRLIQCTHMYRCLENSSFPGTLSMPLSTSYK